MRIKKYRVVYLCVDENGKQSVDVATIYIKGRLTENSIYELQEGYCEQYQKKNALLINAIKLKK